MNNEEEKVIKQTGTTGKAIMLLDQIASIGRPVRFSELESMKLHPKATLYRLLQTLSHLDLLAYNEQTKTYSLGVRLVRLAHTAWQQSSLAPIAQHFLESLANTVNETIHLGQLDNGHVLYIDKRFAGERIRMLSSAGKVGPCFCTGIGKAMLAFLPPSEQERVINLQAFHRFTETTLTNKTALRKELLQIKLDGIAFDREEHETGIICIAAPILSTNGGVIGGISITSSTQRSSLEKLEHHKDLLQNTAKQIGEEAEHWHFPEHQLNNN